jgi:hypothetical protein
MLKILYTIKNKNKLLKTEAPIEDQKEIINDVKPIKKTKLKNDSKIKMNITKKNNDDSD